MTDWFIRLFKHVLSLHDLVEVLMIQFKKGDEEIMQILTKHGFDAEELQRKVGGRDEGAPEQASTAMIVTIIISSIAMVIVAIIVTNVLLLISLHALYVLALLVAVLAAPLYAVDLSAEQRQTPDDGMREWLFGRSID